MNRQDCQQYQKGQAMRVLWEDLKQQGVPPQLKISLIAIILHNSRLFCAILDTLLGVKPLMTARATLEAQVGTIKQLSHSLMQVIHTFAEVTEANRCSR